MGAAISRDQRGGKFGWLRSGRVLTRGRRTSHHLTRKLIGATEAGDEADALGRKDKEGEIRQVDIELRLGMRREPMRLQRCPLRSAPDDFAGVTAQRQARMGDRIALARLADQQGATPILPQGRGMRGERRDKDHWPPLGIARQIHPRRHGMTIMGVERGQCSEPSLVQNGPGLGDHLRGHSLPQVRLFFRHTRLLHPIARVGGIDIVTAAC